MGNGEWEAGRKDEKVGWTVAQRWSVEGKTSLDVLSKAPVACAAEMFQVAGVSAIQKEGYRSCSEVNAGFLHRRNEGKRHHYQYYPINLGSKCKRNLHLLLEMTI